MMSNFKKTSKGLSIFIISFMVMGIVMASGYSSSAWAALKFGVLAKRGSAVAKKKWGPLADYLTSQIGEKVVLVPLTFVGIEPAVKGKKIDYLLANSGFFVEMNKKYGVFALATMLNKRQNQALDRFGGVIFSKKGTGIKTLSDIKGKRFMCVKKTSFGGGQMAFRHMLERGINPFKDMRLLEGRKHDNVVFMVLKGKVDAGTVRSDTLERMEAEGKIKMNDFFIIDKVDDGFPFVHSTILYPEWPFAALKHTAKETNQKIKKALMSIKPNDPVAASGKFVGWIEPLDYTPVAQCLDIIKNNI